MLSICIGYGERQVHKLLCAALKRGKRDAAERLKCDGIGCVEIHHNGWASVGRHGEHAVSSVRFACTGGLCCLVCADMAIAHGRGRRSVAAMTTKNRAQIECGVGTTERKSFLLVESSKKESSPLIN
ncbi:hypothetical protein GOP47_0002540 [Adiantum capillus-veneris]|uniref:Uncharacterized protein n=1 Tax=Adiantum capillus-veneris TaxID=13818 RepID=A0A9D4VC98_ADICA|nr:hypothetical protein GOP47_0002540 [Adiantum capillus-veneris]